MRKTMFVILPVILATVVFPAIADEDFDYDFFFTDDVGITITGTIQTSQQMTVIAREEIQQSGTADFASLLQDTLGLNLIRQGPFGNVAGLRMRGLDARRLAFLVNGIPANSALGGEFDINQIDVNSIERIEVIHGGSDTRHNVSGAMGGVINIITVRREQPGLRLGFSASNTSLVPGRFLDFDDQRQSPVWGDLADTQNITFSAAYGSGNISLSANVFANRAGNHFLYQDEGEMRRRENNQVRDTGATASVLWELPSLASLIFSTNVYYGDRNIPELAWCNDTFSLALTGNANRQHDFSTRNSFIFDMPRAFHDNLAAEASVSWNFARRDFTQAPSDFSRHDQQNVIVINRWSWFHRNRLVLQSGFDYRFDYIDSTSIGNRNRHNGGFYLTAEYSPVQQFMIIPSIKAVFSSEGDKTITAVPKLGFLWNMTDSFTLRSNYFRSFKLPDFMDLYWPEDGWSAGNPNLRPEDGWGADIGIAWRLTEQAALESTFFAKRLTDSIQWHSNDGMIWRPENMGRVVFFGLENKLAFVFPVSIGPVRNLRPSILHQYLLSYMLNDGNTFASNVRFPYSPEHTVRGSLDILWGTGSLLLSGHFESQRYHTDNVTTLRPHFLLNAFVNQQLNENFSAFVVMRNILNWSYESVYTYPMPGFTLTLGLRANFNIDTNRSAK